MAQNRVNDKGEEEQEIGFNILGVHFGGHSDCTGASACAGVHITTAKGCQPATYSNASRTPCYGGADSVHRAATAYKTVSRYGSCGNSGHAAPPQHQDPACAPLVRPAAPACDPEPIPECKPVYRKPCKPRAPCIPPLMQCPGFERILEKFVSNVTFLSLHTLSNQLQLKESMIGGFEETIEHLDNQLGPDFSIVFRPIVIALIQLIEGRLGTGSDADRMTLIDSAEHVLGSASHTLANYFGSMPELCGNHTAIYCILEGWVDVFKALAVVITRLAENNGGDRDAFREASNKALEEATKVGKYLDSLCLKPKPPFSVELPSFSISSGEKSLFHHADTSATGDTGASFGTGQVSGDGDGDGDLFLLQQQQQPQQSEAGTTLEPVIGAELEEMMLVRAEIPGTKRVDLTILDSKAVNLRRTTGWEVPTRGKYSKQKSIPSSEKSKVTALRATITGSGFAKVFTPLKDRSGESVDEFDALKLTKVGLQMGRFGVYGDGIEKGDNLTYVTEAGTSDFLAFPVSGKTVLNVDFKISLLRESKKGSIAGAKRAGSADGASTFDTEEYSFKGRLTLTPRRNEGVYKFPQQLFPSGRRAHARIRISDTPAALSLPGRVDQRLFGITRIELFINDVEAGASKAVAGVTKRPSTRGSAVRGRGRGRGAARGTRGRVVRGARGGSGRGGGRGRGSNGNASTNVAALRRLAQQQRSNSLTS